MCDNINIKKVGKLLTKERADADELAKKVRVLCWIMTGPDNHETKVGAGFWINIVTKSLFFIRQHM